ncbi:hypothetical protein DY000_02060836 [Brassica cretica]|uniref:Uncharacterized protein n=1 Tax=Brassica cretica TaxID=69181 RepID=A0ABQ7ATB1_BRACR|nr:hypothetical protein DY000_02060836 [Brassica cretica]
MEPSGITTVATARQDHASLVPTIRRRRPPSCSSGQVEPVTTDHVAIRVQTKPHVSSEVSPTVRVDHAATPEIASAAGPAMLRCRPPLFFDLLRRHLPLVSCRPFLPSGVSPVTRKLGQVDSVQGMSTVFVRIRRERDGIKEGTSETEPHMMVVFPEFCYDDIGHVSS